MRMKEAGLNGKTFRTFSNSGNGEVGSDTLFQYHVDGLRLQAVLLHHGTGVLLRYYHDAAGTKILSREAIF